MKWINEFEYNPLDPLLNVKDDLIQFEFIYAVYHIFFKFFVK